MDRRIFNICIQATKMDNQLIRVSTDCDSSNSKWSNVMQKEWNFLEDILETFTGNEHPVTAIVRIAKEYEGYGQGN